MKTVLLIGNLTTDVGDGAPRDGGAVYYAAAAATRLGWHALCVTRAARSPAEVPAEIAANESWHVVPSEATTTFRNVYAQDGSREQAVLTAVPMIGPEHVPSAWRSPDAIHLAPVAHELTSDILTGLSAPFIGIGVQGWLRAIGADGRVSPAPWSVPAEVIARSSAAAVSEEDLGAESRLPEELARTLPLLALTRGARGATIFTGGRRVEIQSLAVDAVDPTGAGDVFAATLFLLLAEGLSPIDAGRRAAVAASMSVKSTGLAGLGSRAEIEQLAER